MLKLAEGISNFSLVDAGSAKTFDDFVLLVAENIFVQAVGRPVTDSLLRNFLILDPKLKEHGPDQLSRFQNLLQDSFGDLSSSIMQVILEEVCILLDERIANIKKGDFLQMLQYLKGNYNDDNLANK